MARLLLDDLVVERLARFNQGMHGMSLDEVRAAPAPGNNRNFYETPFHEEISQTTTAMPFRDLEPQ